MTKRVFDCILASLGLIAVAPLFPIIAICIKFDSSGPVFFKQVRIGRGFRPFAIYKFRSMKHEASLTGGSLTIGKDPRISRVGKFLRDFKLDEIPQLINVLKGDMSLVGPRPEVPKYVEMFREEYKTILSVRPGLTDLASLKYINEAAFLPNSQTSEKEYTERILPEKIKFSSYYVQHSSSLFDLKIIIQTGFHMLGIQVPLVEYPDQSSTLKRKEKKQGNFSRKMVSSYRHPILLFRLFRRPIIVVLDLCLIILANYLAFWLRFDGNIPQDNFNLFIQMLPWLVLIRLTAFFAFQLNEGLWRYTSIWDLKKILLGVLTSTLGFAILVIWVFEITDYPRTIYFIDTILLIGLLVGIRLPFRLFKEMAPWKHKKKVLIIGASDPAERVLREMQANPSYHYKPVGFVAEDNSLLGQRIHGVKVLGTRQDLPAIVKMKNPQEILVALTKTNPSMIREIVTALEPFKIPIKTLPSFRDLLEGSVTVNQIRSLDLEDLLPRDPIGSNSERSRKLIEGKKVLVTGAGGSIGSELCRQISSLKPEALILYERHENSLYSIGNELASLVGTSPIYLIIGDITDKARLQEVFGQYRPHIIFHAAAHKHVPLMEENAVEAVKNNVLGTDLLAQTAEQFAVEKFVLISTDKAVNPTSVMGATKRAAELIIKEIAVHSQTHFSTVRFGNVLGSNGSVVPLFKDQIEAGGPVTVTHPEMRRYFMLIPEAVHLVLQAASLEQGDNFILDMGDQLKVLDLARNIIRLSGHVPDQEIPIAFVGLRPGEKLQEELVGPGETTEPSAVEKIHCIVSTNGFSSEALARTLREFTHLSSLNNAEIIQILRNLIPTYETPNHLEGNLQLLAGHKPQMSLSTFQLN